MSLWACPKCHGDVFPNGNYYCPVCGTPMAYVTIVLDVHEVARAMVPIQDVYEAAIKTASEALGDDVPDDGQEMDQRLKAAEAALLDAIQQIGGDRR